MKIHELTEETVLDRPPTTDKQDAPLYVPGGATVVVLNDRTTPFQVVIEAIMAGAGLSKFAATKRMMQAHRGGWSAVASYPSRDIAETVASKIEEHAAANDRYEELKQVQGFRGPWTLTCDVMDAEDAR
jgi:ATP-dependent Clp protease adapter protein ClpS